MRSALQVCCPPFPVSMRFIALLMDARNKEYINCSLDGSGHLYMAPMDLPPLPNIPQASFFHPQSPGESLIVECLKALETVSNKDLLTRHLLPWMETVPTAVRDDLSTAKEALVNWLVERSPPISEEWQRDIFSQPIIPLPVESEQRQYRCLSGMVDPSSDLARLYNPEERLFPCPEFLARHKEALLAYGLQSKPLWSTPLERAEYLSQHPSSIAVSKIESLLELPVLPELTKSEAAIKKIRSLKWLPGITVTGQPTFLAPNECRGADESHLVDKVLATTAISVKSSYWKSILGEHRASCRLWTYADQPRLEPTH